MHTSFLPCGFRADLNYPDVAFFSNSYDSNVMSHALSTLVFEDLFDVIFDYNNKDIVLLIVHAHVISTHFSNIIGFPRVRGHRAALATLLPKRANNSEFCRGKRNLFHFQ